MIQFYDSLERAERVARYRGRTLKVLVIVAASMIVFWQLLLLSSDAFGDERNKDQPWLMDLPEEVVVEEEKPPVDGFWGYQYTPIVITWYGKYVPKFKHELEPFRAFGAQATSTEVSQQCEDKIDEMEKSLNKAAQPYKDFSFVVVCLGKYIVKIVEEEEKE